MLLRRLTPRPRAFPRPACRRTTTRRTLHTSKPRRSILGVDEQWYNPAALHHTFYPVPRGATHREIVQRRLKDRADPKYIKTYPSLIPSARARCKDPLDAITQHQLSVLDPTGARTKLFDKRNNEGAKVGDILLVRTKDGEPFAGVCINIRRRGVDTGILLRDQATRVGVEMWFKVFSPNVEGVEVVQRKQKRARRARLYYMRKPKHDVGSVQNVVQQYIRQRQALRSGRDAKGRDGNSHKRKKKGK